MPEARGVYDGKLQFQHRVITGDEEGHELGLMQVAGRHSAPDTIWDGAIMTYVGMSDTTPVGGKQDGYFSNIHPNGDTSGGTFEAEVSFPNGVMQVQGKWHLNYGGGGLAGIKGGGQFTAEMTSPSTARMMWSGSYETGE